MTMVWLCIVLVSLCWGGWPLVARSAGETGATGSLVILASALAPVALLMAWEGPTLPSTPALAKLAVAGVLNGVGLVAFHFLSSDPAIEISSAVPVVDTGMLLVTALGGILFFTEALTLQKGVGVVLLVAGIALLRPGQPS
jgi:drug/metabolite transporter (DMT)-like permease